MSSKRQIYRKLVAAGIHVYGNRVKKSDIRTFLAKAAAATESEPYDDAVALLDDNEIVEQFPDLEFFVDFVAEVLNGGVEQFVNNSDKVAVRLDGVSGLLSEVGEKKIPQLIANLYPDPKDILGPDDIMQDPNDESSNALVDVSWQNLEDEVSARYQDVCRKVVKYVRDTMGEAEAGVHVGNPGTAAVANTPKYKVGDVINHDSSEPPLVIMKIVDQDGTRHYLVANATRKGKRDSRSRVWTMSVQSVDSGPYELVKF
jgi:hypothetical protein